MTPVAKTTIWFHGSTNNKQQRTNASKSKRRRRTLLWTRLSADTKPQQQQQRHWSCGTCAQTKEAVLCVGVETERSHLAGHVQRPKKQLCVWIMLSRDRRNKFAMPAWNNSAHKAEKHAKNGGKHDVNMNPRVQNQGADARLQSDGAQTRINFSGGSPPLEATRILGLPPGVGMGLDFQACQSPSLVERWPNWKNRSIYPAISLSLYLSIYLSI